MKAKRVFESIGFQRGLDPKDSLNIGIFHKFKNILSQEYFNNEDSGKETFNNSFFRKYKYPFEEYVRLVKKFLSNPLVQKKLDDNNIDHAEAEIKHTMSRAKEESVENVLIHFIDVAGREKLLAEIPLAIPRREDIYPYAVIGPQTNIHYNLAGQTWDQIWDNNPTRKSIFK